VFAEERGEYELRRLNVSALTDLARQLDSGLLGFLLRLVPAMPLPDPTSVRAAAEVEHDAVAVAALDDRPSAHRV
jgi:hypothetical protein